MSVQPKMTEKHGAGLGIRYLLHYGGDKCAQIRDSVENWLATKDFPGSIDVQHVVAVAKSIGSAAGLLAGDHWADAQLDTIALAIYDILQKVGAWYRETDQVKREKMKEDLEKDVINYYFTTFEAIVKKNNGHFSGKLTWLDIFFVGVIETLEFYLGATLIAKYPCLVLLVKKIYELPEIKQYLHLNKK